MELSTKEKLLSRTLFLLSKITSCRWIYNLIKKLNYFPDPSVRDTASEALGVLMKLLGEPTMTKLMPDLDPLKMNKIKEFAEKAEITGKKPKLQPEGGAAAAPPKASGAKVVKPGQPKKATVVKPGAAKKPVPKAPETSDEEDNYEAEFAAPLTKQAAPKTAATARAGSAPARKTSAPAAAARPRPGEDKLLKYILLMCYNI